MCHLVQIQIFTKGLVLQAFFCWMRVTLLQLFEFGLEHIECFLHRIDNVKEPMFGSYPDWCRKQAALVRCKLGSHNTSIVSGSL